MNLIVIDTYEDGCRIAAEMMREVVNKKPKAKLGFATGSTPLPIYSALIEMNKKGDVDFSKTRAVNLDEYWGLAGEHPQSYRYFMDHNLFNHINIDKQNTYVPLGVGDETQNTAALDRKVFEGGVTDVQLLGIGNNGHIGFNEAGDFLVAESHIEVLTQSTISANARFFNNPGEMPTKAITMGMRSIMAAKKIILIATGSSKRKAVSGLISTGAITPHNPATILKLHDDVTVIIDKELAMLAGA